MKPEFTGYPEDAFSRRDESDDTEFYSRNHQESKEENDIAPPASSTIEGLVGRLLAEEGRSVLDLMAGRHSHIPEALRPEKVVGLGPDARALEENEALSESVFHDLNGNPDLPFEGGTFDVVLCTLSVDRLTRPLAVFREAGRVLRPGGILAVTYSSRFSEAKAVKVWRDSRPDERMFLVIDYFSKSEAFSQPRVFVSSGKSKSQQEERSGTGTPPVYAVYARKPGATDRPEGTPPLLDGARPLSREEIEERKRQVKETLCCPYCGEDLEKWMVPDSPFNEWPNEYFYVCFNDHCAYFVEGWDMVASMGSFGSYRLTYDPLKDAFHPAPVLASALPKG